MSLKDASALEAKRRAEQQEKTEDFQQDGNEKVIILEYKILRDGVIVGEMKRTRDPRRRRVKSKKSGASSLVRPTPSECRDVLDGSQHGHKQDPHEQIRGSLNMMQGIREDKASISELSTEKINPDKPIDVVSNETTNVQLAKQLKEALAEKDQLSYVNKTLRSHLNSKDGEMDILKSQMVAAQQVGVTLREENQSLESRITSLEKKLQQAQSEVTKCKGYLKSKDEEMEILRSQMAASKRVGHTLKEENQSLTCETTRLKKELEQAQSEVNKCNGYLKSKDDEMDKLKLQMVDAQQIGGTLKEENESFKSRIVRYKKKLQQAKKSKDVENILKLQMIATVNQVGVTLKIENESLKSMIENLKKKLQRAKCEMIKCKGYLKSKDGEMDRIKSEMEAAQKVAVNVKDENESLKSTVNKLEQELRRLTWILSKVCGSD